MIKADCDVTCNTNAFRGGYTLPTVNDRNFIVLVYLQRSKKIK